jgi:hypothetical protein
MLYIMTTNITFLVINTCANHAALSEASGG